MLVAAEQIGDSVTPEEVILRANMDGTDRDELVKMLAEMTYSFTEYAPGVLNDGSNPGTWNQVLGATLDGTLSDEEFARVSQAVRPPNP